MTEPVDLESVVRRWAEMMFNETKTKEQSKIPKAALEYNINWNKVIFAHGDPEFSDRRKPTKPKSHVLFRTFFTNQTTQDQEYSFRTSRVTSSTCDVTMEQCYTIGEELNVTLKTPMEVFEANAGFHRELSLAKATGQSIEEELSWEVDSQIKVPKGKRTTAELVISEDQMSSNFVITTAMSGKVLVTVTNRHDNNSFVKAIEGKIAEIIRGMKDRERGLNLFQFDKHSVRFNTKGYCNFRYAVEQHIKLQQEEILEKEAE